MLDTLKALRASEGVGERTYTPHMYRHIVSEATTRFCTVKKLKNVTQKGKKIKFFLSFTETLERVMWINGEEAQGK